MTLRSFVPLANHPSIRATIQPCGFIHHFTKTLGKSKKIMNNYMAKLDKMGHKWIDKKIYVARISLMELAFSKNINASKESPSIITIEEVANSWANAKRSITDNFG